MFSQCAVTSDDLFYFICNKQIYYMKTATDGDKVWYSQGSLPDHHADQLSIVMIQDNLIITSNGNTDGIDTSPTTRAAALAKAAPSLRGSISTIQINK